MRLLLLPVMYVAFFLKNLVLWIDQGGNVLLMGDPDETISRRAGRARDRGQLWGCWLCRVLDWIDPRHCAKSFDGDQQHEGHNSVPQMIARWRRGEPATWVPLASATHVVPRAAPTGASKPRGTQTMWTAALAALKAAWAWVLPYAGPVIAFAAPLLEPLGPLVPSRRSLGIAAVMLAIGVSAWWLWPRPAPPDVRVERFAVGVSRQTVELYKQELARAIAAAEAADEERQRADDEGKRADGLVRELEEALKARAGAATAVCFPPHVVTMINQSRTGRKVKP